MIVLLLITITVGVLYFMGYIPGTIKYYEKKSDIEKVNKIIDYVINNKTSKTL